MSDPGHPERPGTDGPGPGGHDLDDVASRLQDALHHVPPVPVSADPGLVDELGRRSAARRRGKIAAGTLVVACLVLASGAALAASRHGSGATNLAAGGVATSTSARDATTTSVDSYELTSPSTSPSTSASGSPTSVVGDPTTTVPSGSSLPASSTSTSAGDGHDCGSYGPSGWPTTIMYPPDSARCLLDGFASGAPDTFHLVIADTDYPAHQITEDFLILGVGRVRVRVDRTRALHPPKTVVTEVCRQLSYQGDGSVYAFSRCS